MTKIAIPLFLILLSGGLFFSYTDPTYQSMNKLKEENAQYDEALNKSKELRVVRDTLLSKYNTFAAEDIDRLNKLLPDNVDNVRLIMEIDSIALKYGAIIRKVDVGSQVFDDKSVLGPPTAGYGTIDLNFVIEASYDDFIKFLSDLSNSLRIADVTNLSFQSSALGSYKYKLDIKTYWLK
ncbi:MAG: type 4a pilus biogenesis protein PilO [Patescibacteria group bacterium]